MSERIIDERINNIDSRIQEVLLKETKNIIRNLEGFRNYWEEEKSRIEKNYQSGIDWINNVVDVASQDDHDEGCNHIEILLKQLTDWQNEKYKNHHKHVDWDSIE